MTDLQRMYPIVIFTFLIIIFGFVAGCSSTSSPESVASPAPLSTTSTNTIVERVEVIHFHGNRQCVSCIAVGDLAEKTVNEQFSNELASGRLVFAHVNYDLPESALLKADYGVTGSSLWIGVYDENGFHKEQNTLVWSLIDDEAEYSRYLSALLAKRLNGNLS